MPTIEVEYGLKDRVHLIEISRPGTVVAIWYGDLGTMYKVAFWADSSRKEEYVFPFEIRKAED